MSKSGGVFGIPHFIAWPVLAGLIAGIYGINNLTGVYFDFYSQSADGNTALIAKLKKSKGTDESLDDHQLNSFENHKTYKPTPMKVGYERISIIKDYSVKLMTPCTSGTGWFLDYVLPKDKKSYPTKWFIATNAHVISNMSFESNPYQQTLPKKLGNGCRTERMWPMHTPLILFKDNALGINDDAWIRQYELYQKKKSQDYAPLTGVGGNVWWNISEWSDLRGDEKFLYYLAKSPKLMYVPINYMGKGINKFSEMPLRFNYYKDFAVLEIEFESPQEAQMATRNFYGKYDRKDGTHKDKALNLFADEVAGHSTQNKDYFIAGYPASGVKNTSISKGNYSGYYGRASRMVLPPHRDLWIKNNKGQPIPGIANVGWLENNQGYRNSTRTNWRNKDLMSWGYNYVIDNNSMNPGASGSLATDDQGNVLGLYRMQDINYKLGYVEPLRSKGIYRNGKIVMPEYDLISGTDVQFSSYRSQLEKYVLSKGETTSLSEYRNWHSTEK